MEEVRSLALPLRLGAATLLRFPMKGLSRLSPCGICALQRFVTLSDRFIIALWTNPPRPLVGDVERVRSGDIRRCVGDGGIGSSAGTSAGEGSSFGASDRACTGDPNPVSGEADDTLEYRLLKLLSPIVDAVRGGDDSLSSTTSVFSGSAIIPGN